MKIKRGDRVMIDPSQQVRIGYVVEVADVLADAVRVVGPGGFDLWVNERFIKHPRDARRTDPETSHAAVTNIDRRGDQQRVLAVHAQHSTGLTDFELANLCGRSQTSLGKRRGELRDAGLIEDSGRKRPAPSGALATVWRITEAGMEIMRGKTA